jgi:hypothetical protein
MPKRSLRMRRFIAKYIQYLTIFGYLYVALVGIVVATLWFVKVDEVATGSAEIRPHEEVLRHQTDVVVMDLLVENHADVSAGQDLVTICTDPASAKSNGSPEKNTTAPAAECGGAIKALRAPFSGVAVIPKGIKGRTIPAGWEIVKVIDFSNLNMSAYVGGTQIRQVRKDQRVKVTPTGRSIGAASTSAWRGGKGGKTAGGVADSDVRGETFQSDLDYPGWWRKGHAQFNAVGEGKIKSILQEHFSGQVMTLGKEENGTFVVSNVAEVELRGVLQVAESEDGRLSEGVSAEPFIGIALEGTVKEATHSATVDVRDLPDGIRQQIEQTLWERLRDGVRVDDSAMSGIDSLRSKIESPILSRLREGLREDNTPLSVVGIDNVQTVVSLNLTMSDASGLPDASSLPVESTGRYCSVKVTLADPPPDFTAKVRELALAERPSYFSVNLEVVVGARRVAMLLFRK